MADQSAPPMAHPRVASGLLLHDDAMNILLVKPTYKDGWDIPGGYVEPNESPAQAAERELLEELGMKRECGRLLVVDWAPHPAEGDKLLFVFDGGTLTPDNGQQPRPDGEEIAEARLWPPAVFVDLMPARLARRIQLAVDALSAREKLTMYAEHGAPVSQRFDT
ncbi:MAG: hydrolase [Mycobacterium sp.]|nr:hydrolase [Mycobacterium sp.]